MKSVPPYSIPSEVGTPKRIDECCFKMGPFAVVVQAVPFVAQLKEALRRHGQKARAALVRYYDDETFHGSIDPQDIPFRKQKRFEYQQEFRICIETNTEGDDPLVLDIGDLSPIAAKIETSQLNDQFKVQLSRAPAPPEGPAK